MSISTGQEILLDNLNPSSQNQFSATQTTGNDGGAELRSRQPGPPSREPANEANDIPKVPVPNVRNQVPENGRDRWSVFARRHAQFLAICLSIGSGLLYDSGPRLYYAGPVPLFIAYFFVGTVLYSVMITLGEMISLLPIRGALFMLPYRFLNKQSGFACGWLYLFSFAFDYPHKAIVFANCLSYWRNMDEPWKNALAITIFLFIPLIVNILIVRIYGETEFWLTLIKVTAIIGLISAGIIIAAGGVPSPLLGTSSNYRPVPCSENDISISPCLSPPGFGYWRETPFKRELWSGGGGYFAAVWDCINIAAFSFTGNELVGILADETERQRESLSSVVRRIPHRIIPYYVFAMLALGITVSANDPILNLPSSGDPIRNYPGGFVIMAERAGIPVLPHIINVIMILAALSTATGDIYVTSRCLQALSEVDLAPSLFKPEIPPPIPVQQDGVEEEEQRNRQPMWYHVSRPRLAAVFVSGSMFWLAYLSLATGSSNIFQFLINMTSTASFISWALICLTYLYFKADLKRWQEDADTVPEARSVFQPLFAIYGLFWSTIIGIFLGFKSWNRSPQYWGNVDDSWGFTFASWAVIGLFIVMYLLSTFLVGGHPFRRAVRQDEAMNGRAPELGPVVIMESEWKRTWKFFLNNL